MTQFQSARECSTQRQTRACACQQNYLAAGAGAAGTAGTVAPGTKPGIAAAGAAGTLGTLEAPGTAFMGTALPGTALPGTAAPVAAGALFGTPGTAEPAAGATGAVCEKFCMMPVSCPLVPRFVT